MKSDEDDAGENELREAQALAAALDGAPAPEQAVQVPEDALQTAALLRHAGADGELSTARAEAVLEKVLASATGAAMAQRTQPRRWRHVPVAAGFAVALAAAALLILKQRDSARQDVAMAPLSPPAGDSQARTLPSPPPALLAAQAELAHGDAAASARFDAQMRDYRGAVLQSLERKYPAQVGWLEPELRCRSRR